MFLKKSLAMTTGLLMSFGCAASSVSLSFNNDNVDLNYNFELQETLSLKGTFLQTVDNGYTFDTGLYASQDVGAIFSEIGAKAMAMDTDNGDGYALAFGGLTGLHLTEELSVFAEGHYSPEILGTGDVENYLQFGGGITYAVLPSADIYLKYVFTDIDYEDKTTESVTRDLLFGMKWVF